ncbi:MAG: hypothetical protein H7Y33_03545 [Cytophagales bacterium]|nr:hypothetical protein [Rhizobacter sp.]
MKPIASKLLLVATAATAAAFASIAHAQVIELEWDAQQQFIRSLDVAPGKFVEVCGKLTPPAKVEWQFEAGTPLNFNVHYHEGKEVRFSANKDAQVKLEGELQVKTEQDYCWMWSNKSPAASPLTLRLRRVS